MIYTQSQQDSIIYQSQVWMADMGVKLEALERSMQPCEDLYCQNYNVIALIAALQKDTNLEEYREENIYTCLIKITDIKDYPAFTPIMGTEPPAIIIGQPGPAGPSGADGAIGTDAFIECISEDDGITIETRDVAGVKTFVWTHTPYIEPGITLALDPNSITEIGNVLDITLNMNLTKGRDDVTASVITSDPTLDAAYQSILDLAGLNAGGVSGRSIVASGVLASTTYTVNISDEATPVVKDTESKTITFVYPFLYGVSKDASLDPYSFPRVLQTKGTKAINYIADDDYIWFCYPATYGLLSSIKDKNNFEYLDSAEPTFAKIDIDVSSSGLTNNWTNIPYYCYRSNEVTVIEGIFTFMF